MSEIRSLEKIAVLSTYFLDLSYNLSDNNIFKHGIKKKGNQFIKEIQKLENMVTNVKDKDELLKLCDQMSNNADAVDNILEVLLNIKNDNQREYFNTEFKKLSEKFNLIENE